MKKTSKLALNRSAVRVLSNSSLAEPAGGRPPPPTTGTRPPTRPTTVTAPTSHFDDITCFTCPTTSI